MDLHWYLNNANFKNALQDIFRFWKYLGRFLASSRFSIQLDNIRYYFIVDVSGAVGTDILHSLLKFLPDNLNIAIFTTDYIYRNNIIHKEFKEKENILIINLDNYREATSINIKTYKEITKLIIRNPKIIPTIPIFLFRWHMYSAISKKAFNQNKAVEKIIVFNERMMPSAIFSESARDAGVNVIAIQHGNFVRNYLPIAVDEYFTWGEKHSKWVHDHSNCKTTIIGSPRLDQLKSYNLIDYKLLKKEKIAIVFFSQLGSASVSPEMIAHTRNEILKASSNPLFNLFIKLHPLDSIENWNINQLNNNVSFLDKKTTLIESFEKADIICSFYSSVLIEALLSNKPIIQLNPFPNQVTFIEQGTGIKVVNNYESLLEHIEELRTSENNLTKQIKEQAKLREKYFAHIGSSSQLFWKILTKKHVIS